MNPQELQELWKSRIKEANSSDQTITDWCKENDISKPQYYYWNRKINKGDAQKKQKESSFVEVSALNVPHVIQSNATSGINISWRDFSIKVCNTQDIPMAVELMKTLGESC